MRRGDVDMVKAKADQIMEMYLRRIMGASGAAKFQDLKQQVGEAIISWENGLRLFREITLLCLRYQVVSQSLLAIVL